MDDAINYNKDSLPTEKNNKCLLNIKNITKNYGKTEVLRGINFKVFKGEKIAILGANGCGKTTLVELICRTKKFSSGSISYNFKNKSINNAIGVQFQEGNWPDSLSSFDIINFYKEIYPSVTKEWVDNLLSVFGLKEFYKRPLNRLSGGQKQRFNALLAVLHKPELLILDEISNGLDIQLKHNILVFLEEWLNESQSSLLIVSHNPTEVEYLCNRLVLIDKGKIIINMTVSDVIKKYNSVDNMMNLYFERKLK